jgi:predicted RNA-binding protein
LLVEIRLNAIRSTRKNDLVVYDYHDLMIHNIDEVTDKRLMVLREIEKDKIMVAKAYNKNVKAEPFQVVDLVWKTILPLRSFDRKFVKWSPS